MSARDDLWMIFWVLGIGLALVGVPALLGFFAGSWLEQTGARAPWRVLFVAFGGGVGGVVAWRLIRGPSSR